MTQIKLDTLSGLSPLELTPPDAATAHDRALPAGSFDDHLQRAKSHASEPPRDDPPRAAPPEIKEPSATETPSADARRDDGRASEDAPLAEDAPAEDATHAPRANDPPEAETPEEKTGDAEPPENAPIDLSQVEHPQINAMLETNEVETAEVEMEEAETNQVETDKPETDKPETDEIVAHDGRPPEPKTDEPDLQVVLAKLPEDTSSAAKEIRAEEISINVTRSEDNSSGQGQEGETDFRHETEMLQPEEARPAEQPHGPEQTAEKDPGRAGIIGEEPEHEPQKIVEAKTSPHESEVLGKEPFQQALGTSGEGVVAEQEQQPQAAPGEAAPRRRRRAAGKEATAKRIVEAPAGPKSSSMPLLRPVETAETATERLVSPAQGASEAAEIAPKPAADSQGERQANAAVREVSNQVARNSPLSQAAGEAAPGQVDRARFVQRVSRAFQAIGSRNGAVRLRLHPPELGSLRLEITLRNGVMSARMEAETQTARNLLLDNLPALRDRLAQQDIKVEQFDVELMDRSSGGLPEQTSDQTQSQDRGQADRAASPDSEAHEEGESPSGRAPIGRAGEGTQLNVVV